MKRAGAILPPRDARDGSLVLTIAILCAFAGIAAIAALAANRAAADWTAGLTGTASVIVRANEGDTPDQAAARAAELLAGLPGVEEAQALPKAAVDRLLAPWLGEAAALADLPTPRLIDLTLSPETPAQRPALEAALSAAGLDATVDDHRTWTEDIQRAAAAARWAAGGLAVIAAIAAAAVAAFATRASLRARADLVEILHLTGGRDGHIARMFAWRAGWAALIAGAIGGAAAAGAGAALRLTFGVEGVSPLLPVGWIDVPIVLAAAPVAAIVAAASAWSSARRLLAAMA